MEESLLVKKASLTAVFWKVVFSTEYSSMCKVNCFPWKSKSSQNIYFFTITRRAKNLCAPVPKITCCSLWGRDWGALHWHVRQVQAWLKHCLVFFHVSILFCYYLWLWKFLLSLSSLTFTVCISCVHILKIQSWEVKKWIWCKDDLGWADDSLHYCTVSAGYA